MAKVKKRTQVAAKKKGWHPSVMAHLMRQAQEEDYRREKMAESELAARSHLADFGGECGG